MAKKEYVQLIPESLQLATIIHYNNLSAFNSFSGKEVFITEGFEGDAQYLKIILGYMGAYVETDDLDKNITVIIIGNNLLNDFNRGENINFFRILEDKLNQDSSPFRRCQIISEDHFIWYLEKRNKTNPTEQIMEYLQEYKRSKRNKSTLFD